MVPSVPSTWIFVHIRLPDIRTFGSIYSFMGYNYLTLLNSSTKISTMFSLHNLFFSQGMVHSNKLVLELDCDVRWSFLSNARPSTAEFAYVCDGFVALLCCSVWKGLLVKPNGVSWTNDRPSYSLPSPRDCLPI